MRERVEEALRLDLVGPDTRPARNRLGSDVAEELRAGWVPASSWCLTGFLMPATRSGRQDPSRKCWAPSPVVGNPLLCRALIADNGLMSFVRP